MNGTFNPSLTELNGTRTGVQIFDGGAPSLRNSGWGRGVWIIFILVAA